MKHHRGAFLAHQRGEGLGIEGVAAQNAMRPKQPQISRLADRRRRRDLGQDIGRVGTRGRRVVERGDPQIDLAHLKAGDFDVKIETAERQVAQLLGQQTVVPSRDSRSACYRRS